MYLDHFQLKKEPFQVTPDPAFLYLSHGHKEALAAVVYGVQQRKGFILLTGEVGVGKTTILRSYLQQVMGPLLQPVYLFNVGVYFPTLLKTICAELGVHPTGDLTDDLLRDLHRFLIKEFQRGRNVVFIIDEAQNMPVRTLESLRMLSNLETSSGKLIQIVFSGQPEFDTMLERHDLRQLKQRIAVRAKLAPLTRKESAEYVHHRLTMSGQETDRIFTPRALKLIVGYARGIPRTINIVCDNALVTTFGNRKKRVTGAIVKEIIADLDSGKRSACNLWLSAAILVAILAFGWLLSDQYQVLSGNNDGGWPPLFRDQPK